MRNLRPIIIAAMLLGACDRPGDTGDGSSSPTVEARPSSLPATDGAKQTEARWVLLPDAKGTALLLQTQTGARIVSLTCASGGNRLQINVPGFTPIDSEDRLSFGSNGEAGVLIADFRGDKQLGGVSAESAVPSNLAASVRGPISISYGAQTSGPHPAVPQDIVKPFVAVCSNAASVRTPGVVLPDRSVSPCLMQDGQRLSSKSLRAVGTEPFWAARIEGRCVTYSHPEDQQGARVWTRFTPTTHGGGAWRGALGGRQFELRTRSTPGCSDGMSDKSYPLAAELLVNGEQRKGCAEPL